MTEWFRSWHGAPLDPKWLSVAKRANVATAIVVAVTWALLDRASQAADRGSISGYDADGLGEFLDCEAGEVEAVVKALHEKGILQDGRFVKWAQRQMQRNATNMQRAATSTERSRRFRAKKKASETKALEAGNENATVQRDFRQSRVDTEKIPVEQTLPLESHTKTNGVVEGSGEPNSKNAKPRARRIPDDFDPNPTVARELGLTEAQASAELAKFRDYWRAKAGQDAAKLDWLATWRNWCRTAKERRPQNSAPPRQESRWAM